MKKYFLISSVVLITSCGGGESSVSSSSSLSVSSSQSSSAPSSIAPSSSLSSSSSSISSNSQSSSVLSSTATSSSTASSSSSIASSSQSSFSLSSVEASSQASASSFASILLNDTGIELCGGTYGANDQTCPVEGYSGQDGDYGRDAQARAGGLTKIGGGVAGFDFTKLDENGNSLAANASSWACVRDNHTKLIWWVNQGGTYTWYDPDSSNNGGDEGAQNGGNCTTGACDTYALIQYSQSNKPCGADNWRLPTRLELLGIMHNGYWGEVGTWGYGVDTDFFPAIRELWSSQTDARTKHSAWIVNFTPSYLNLGSKSSPMAAWLVRTDD